MGMLKEYYFQQNAPDPVLSNETVLRCVRRFVSGARTVTGIDESGGEARTYTIDNDLILKVQRPQQVRVGTSLAKEVFYLNQLAAIDPDLPVSRVLGYARETNLLEYTLQTRMPGVAFANAALSPEARSAVIFNLGRLMRRLHALPQGPFHDSAHFPADRTSGEFKARIREYFEVLTKRLAQTNRAWPFEISLEALAERIVAALPEATDFVALHANPGPPHTFVNPDSGQFTGLIDFGDAYISHPALDVWRWRWPAERAAALAGYTADAPVSDSFNQIWQALTIVGAAILIVFFPEREAEAIQDLREQLKAL